MIPAIPTIAVLSLTLTLASSTLVASSVCGVVGRRYASAGRVSSVTVGRHFVLLNFCVEYKFLAYFYRKTNCTFCLGNNQQKVSNEPKDWGSTFLDRLPLTTLYLCIGSGTTIWLVTLHVRRMCDRVTQQRWRWGNFFHSRHK